MISILDESVRELLSNRDKWPLTDALLDNLKWSLTVVAVTWLSSHFLLYYLVHTTLPSLATIPNLFHLVASVISLVALVEGFVRNFTVEAVAKQVSWSAPAHQIRQTLQRRRGNILSRRQEARQLGKHFEPDPDWAHVEEVHRPGPMSCAGLVSLLFLNFLQIVSVAPIFEGYLKVGIGSRFFGTFAQLVHLTIRHDLYSRYRHRVQLRIPTREVYEAHEDQLHAWLARTMGSECGFFYGILKKIGKRILPEVSVSCGVHGFLLLSAWGFFLVQMRNSAVRDPYHISNVVIAFILSMYSYADNRLRCNIDQEDQQTICIDQNEHERAPAVNVDEHRSLMTNHELGGDQYTRYSDRPPRLPRSFDEIDDHDGGMADDVNVLSFSW